MVSRKRIRSHSSGSAGFGNGMPITTTHLQHAEIAWSRTLHCLAARAVYRMRQTNRGVNVSCRRIDSDWPDLPRPSPKLMPSDILPPTTQSSRAPVSVPLWLVSALCSAMMLLYCLHWQPQITEARDFPSAFSGGQLRPEDHGIRLATEGEGPSPEHRLDFHG